MRKAIIQSCAADSLVKNFTKVDRFADDALSDVWKWSWKLENVIYKCIPDRQCQDITNSRATLEMRSNMLLLKSLYLKRLRELTIHPNAPQREGDSSIEYVRGVAVLGVEQEDCSADCMPQAPRYVIRVYMTAVGHQMLSKDICSRTERATGIVRPRKSIASSSTDDDIRKCDEAALQSFRDEIQKLSSQAFYHSSAASSWRVHTLKVSSAALLALHTEVSTLLAEDSRMAQILPVPDISLWQERLQEQYLEPIAHQDDIDDGVTGPMDESRRSFDSISQYIESLFALLQTVESVAGDNTAQRLGDLLRRILKNLLEANNHQGVEAVASSSQVQAQLLLRPRPRWVVSEKSVLEVQQYRCYGCGSSLHRPNGIDSALLGLGLPTLVLHRRTPALTQRNYAYCHFYRAYYCTHWCHSGDKRTIPRDLVYDWNREELEVSAQAVYFLDSIHDVPFWNLAEVNSGLYKQVPIVMRVHQLKAELSKAFADRVLGCCRVEAFEEVKRVITDHHAEHKAHYFVTDSMRRSCDLYSLADLMHMHDGTLPVELTELLDKLNSICK